MKKMNLKKAYAGVVGVMSLASASAMAAIDTTEVGTALNGAVASAESVGGMVIAAVAGLVVIGLIIAVVKKMSA